MTARMGLRVTRRGWRWGSARLGAWPGVWLARVGEPPADAQRGVTHAADEATTRASASHASPPDAAYEAFIREHQRAILNYLWRMTGDEQSAYDLTQEVFVRAWRSFEKLRGYERPRGWLFRVATNLALSSLAGRKAPLASVDLLSTEQQPQASDPARSVVERDAVRAALAGLSPQRRAALTLREVYGLSCAEVARALGVSDAAARMTLSRAREQFRTLYLAEGDDEHGA
ncbi:MAG: sigma-70 family RNA polymerase sigma factor [Chloroflexota bacterium]|nr:sigma-70 family RNA polymerase sigma factor [Chloroflexota bacterium]